MMRISATIITKDEERNIARAVESVRCCDEILVVDSGSTDRTLAIAQASGARILHHDWPGYAAQKNYAASMARHDWILSIDADEAVSEELETEIWMLRHEGPEFQAYSMPRLTQYLGRYIRHSGWYPDRKIRLYNRRAARWMGDFVHESVHSDAPVGELQGKLFHYTCSSIAEHVRTMDRYTTLAARELVARGREASVSRMLFAPPATFLKTYLLRAGYRDGFQGLCIAYMAALYVFLKYAKTRLPGAL